MPIPKQPAQVSNSKKASEPAQPRVIRVFGCPPVLWPNDNDDCLDQDCKDAEELCCQEALKWNLAAHSAKYPPFLTVDPEAGVVYLASTNGKQSIWRCPHSGQFFAFASDGLCARMLVDDGQYIQWVASQVVSYEVLREEVGQLALRATPSNAASLGPYVPATSQAVPIGPMHPTSSSYPDSSTPSFSFDACSALFQQGDQAVHIAQGPNGACLPMLLLSGGRPIIAPPGSLLLPMSAAMSLMATSCVPPPTHLPARGPAAASPPQPPAHSRAPSSVSSAGSPGSAFYYQSSDILTSWGGSSVGTGHAADGLVGGPLGSWEMKPSSRGTRTSPGSGTSPPVPQTKPVRGTGEQMRTSQRTGVDVSTKSGSKVASVSSSSSAASAPGSAAAEPTVKEAATQKAVSTQAVSDAAQPAVVHGLPHGADQAATTREGEAKVTDGRAADGQAAGTSGMTGGGARTPAAAAPAGAMGSPEPGPGPASAQPSMTQAGQVRTSTGILATAQPPAVSRPQHQPGVISHPSTTSRSFPAPFPAASTSYVQPAGFAQLRDPSSRNSAGAYGVHRAPPRPPLMQPGGYNTNHMVQRTASAPGGGGAPSLSTTSADHRRWSMHGSTSAPPLFGLPRTSSRPVAYNNIIMNAVSTSSTANMGSIAVMRHSRTNSISSNSSGGVSSRRASMRGGTADRPHGAPGAGASIASYPAPSGTLVAAGAGRTSTKVPTAAATGNSSQPEGVICLNTPAALPLSGPNTLTVQLTTDDAGAALSISSASGTGPATGGTASGAAGFPGAFEISERLMSLAGIHGAVVVVNVNPVAKPGSSLCSSPCKAGSRPAILQAASPLVSAAKVEDVGSRQGMEGASMVGCQ